MNKTKLIRSLANTKSFQSARFAEDVVPRKKAGYYAISVDNPGNLPGPYSKHLSKRETRLIYIGIARKDLRKRLVKQDLRHIGAGIFFRSLGAALGYQPVQSGDMVYKSDRAHGLRFLV